MGRPRKNIDPDRVRRLAAKGCTVEEIAALCDCGKRTIETRFRAEIEKGREQGRESLRRMQWKAAKGGNVTMQIWLGKQLLGQTDKTHATGSQTITIRDETVDAPRNRDDA